MTRRKPERPAPTWADARQLRWSTGGYVDGLWVGAFNAGDEELNRVEEALRLIKVHDPRRYDRLLRDLERVWVLLLPGSLGCFNAALAACQLDRRFVLAETPAVIANTIVHEATHARLWRCGIGYEVELRQRVEAVCFRRELAFATTLPNGDEVHEQALGRLDIPADYWADSAFDEREFEGHIEICRYVGIPDWLIRGLMGLRSFHFRVLRLKRTLADWCSSVARGRSVRPSADGATNATTGSLDRPPTTSSRRTCGAAVPRGRD
jgi:hypothetical protein